MSNTLTVFSRLGCHLCEDMLALIPQYIEGTGLVLEVIDIDEDPDLREKYDRLVPALNAGDREICHYFLDVKALQQYI
ncbi:MAG: glutaredoxin family protein, partial [Woeseiaceae bacterium]